MSAEYFETPIALVVFNRPETTKKVLQAIRTVKPKQLFIIADAPREDSEQDIINCSATKKVIEDGVDWDCQLHKIYAQKNLGCGRGPSSGITKVFEKVDKCIILEDDCLPERSFFFFCEELLNKYYSDSRIMMISGNHHLFKKYSFDYDYFFSRHTQTWGWATWKRAWDLYDYEMSLWPEVKKSKWLDRILGDKLSVRYWEKLFDKCYYEKSRDYWDFQWTFTCWSQNGLNIIPDKNLVTNIGFGESSGTHFSDITSPFANLPTYAMSFPLKHPTTFIQNLEADRQIQKDVYGHISFMQRVKRKLRSILK
ncbi:MAG TPA: hemolytic protein HlpA-like protein [Sphingobacteriaceae bacterium]|nr:hemolytic protein HlpA-like protein [Sphingobacteriaceae bacterium]